MIAVITWTDQRTGPSASRKSRSRACLYELRAQEAGGRGTCHITACFKAGRPSWSSRRKKNAQPLYREECSRDNQALHRKELGMNLLSVEQEVLAQLCRRHHIRRLSLFGSALRGEERPNSDVDLLVEFEPDSWIGRHRG